MTQVLAEDTPERRELVRAIDMVRKRVQRTKRYQPLDGFSTPASDLDQRERNRLELGEILEAARRAVLSDRQDRIIELWMRGWSVPEIGDEMNLPVTRVSDEKYKALRKLERQLRNSRDELAIGLPSASGLTDSGLSLLNSESFQRPAPEAGMLRRRHLRKRSYVSSRVHHRRRSRSMALSTGHLFGPLLHADAGGGHHKTPEARSKISV